MIDKPIKKDLEQIFSCEPILENDANCFAQAETSLGAAKNKKIVFGVILGTGVGGGITINGKVFSGLNNIAGEWGHNTLDPDGPPCYCGQQGCIETYLSGPGFFADYQRLGGANAANAEEVISKVRENEPIAQEALDNLLERFGKAVAGVINILDPHVIVLGGGLSNTQELYEEGPRRIAKYVFNPALETPIRRNLHGDSAGVLGAAGLWAL